MSIMSLSFHPPSWCRRLGLLLLTGLVCLLLGTDAHSAPIPGQIVRLDPRLSALISPQAQLEPLATGLGWLEGPVWDKTQQALLFSDVKNNVIYRWRAGAGIAPYVYPSGYTGTEPFAGKEPGANGLTLDRQGRLVACEHGDRRISRREPNGEKITLADRYQGRRLNSPNDLVYASNGDLYFTDPPFGLPQAFADPLKELPFSGVYRLRPQGELTLLTDQMRSPNGIAFAPDEKTLYLTDVTPGQAAWLAYRVKPDGSLGEKRVLAEATPWQRTRKGGPDGLKIDTQGNIYGAGPSAVFIFAPDGTLLGRIETGVPTGNLAWGEDGHTLFITANTSLYRIRLLAKGNGY
ncbi:gluconolactonase [Gloeomargarita lithophora Alchichica-D10]|uniref:Gluconolactonase n=2 Tax=Gloeomargarita TaxID=1188227 RepID=A0A1J0ABY2_9CYAN|nr:SMP-30/gluconolactonase/LRE family protein [Gloeomargarita lithophora]APB33429.1 gluconolactonase [Gloeomargarita lithophora Alchichica-D10]